MNWSKQEIGDQLGVNMSNYYIELERNSSKGRFQFNTANQANLRFDLQTEYKDRKSKITGPLKLEIDNFLETKWNLEQIQG